MKVQRRPGPFEGLPQCSAKGSAGNHRISDAMTRLKLDCRHLDEHTTLALQLLRSGDPDGEICLAGSGGPAEHGTAVGVLCLTAPRRAALSRLSASGLSSVAPPPTIATDTGSSR